MASRGEVITAARRYIGARWQHQARGDDVFDCVGLLVRVARDLGLGEVPPMSYAEHPDGRTLLRLAAEYMRPIGPRTFAAGDVVVLRFGAAPQHFGIVGDYYAGGFSLIHAYRGVDRVVEHRLDDVWRRRIVAAFALPGVE